MAEFLYRLGSFSARRPWLTLGVWALILVVSLGSFALFRGTLSSNVTIDGLPTNTVTERLRNNIPQAAAGTGTVVLHADAPLTGEQREALTQAIAEVEKVPGVDSILNPFTFGELLEERTQELRNGQEELSSAQTQVEQGQDLLDTAKTFEIPQDSWTVFYPSIELNQNQLNNAKIDLARGEREIQFGPTLVDMARNAPMVSEDGTTALATVLFEGSAMDVTPETKDAVRAAFLANNVDGVEMEFSQEFALNVNQVGGIGEVIGLAVAAAVLVIMIGTLVGAGLPLLNALLGVAIGATVALAFSSVADMLTVTPMLGVMLGLAVGIDYSLFILNRHIRQLRQGMDVPHSVALANGTAGNAVVFAGSTVVIALLALNITGIEFLGVMGTVAAFCVVIAVMIAVTVTPATLSLLGRRILKSKYREQRDKPLASHEPPMSNRRAVVSVVLSVVFLLLAAIPAASMRLGLPDGSSEPLDSSQYQAFKITAEKFGAGANGPLVVLADISDPNLGPVEAQVRLVEALSSVADVDRVIPIGSSEGGSMVAVQVFPEEGPSAESTEILVGQLRTLDLGTAMDISVAGMTTGVIEVSDKIASVLPLYLSVVVGLSLLILVVVFRSVLVPLIATGGFILSVLAAFGGVTAVYQWGWLGSLLGVHDPGPVLSFLPILLIGVLFGLAMDYQLFLTSGMREAYAHGATSRQAVIEGLHAGRNVVIAAAIIMISVFGGFIFSHLAMVRPLGFGLAFGVAVDAFVVRMVLVPALMHLIGDKAWWLPAWLANRLPNVDIEGAQLERAHHLDYESMHHEEEKRDRVEKSPVGV